MQQTLLGTPIFWSKEGAGREKKRRREGEGREHEEEREQGAYNNLVCELCLCNAEPHLKECSHFKDIWLSLQFNIKQRYPG